jgi:clan AA aspartic protease (TIGR02281 family)
MGIGQIAFGFNQRIRRVRFWEHPLPSLLIMLPLGGCFLVSALSSCSPKTNSSDSLYTVNAQELNCREAQDIHSVVRAKLMQYAKVNVLQSQNGWAQIQSESGSCWVKEKFLDPPNSSVAQPVAVGTLTETEVPLEQEGGTFVVPARINDAIELKFTIDSGASDVVIPADVASTLVRTGTITQEDFIGSQTFTLADGSTVPSTEFRIRKLKVGTLELQNVTASLANPNSPLLLGQSFLTRMTAWSIDNQRHVLSLKTTDSGASGVAPSLPAEANGATTPESGTDVVASPASTP